MTESIEIAANAKDPEIFDKTAASARQSSSLQPFEDHRFPDYGNNPEIPKVRFVRLQELCKKALEESIKALTIEKMSSCYPTLSQTEEGVVALRTAREQVSNFWFKSSMKEFNLIFDERNIESKLNQLDEIIYEAHIRKEKYDSSLDEEQIYTVHKESTTESPVLIDELTPKDIISSHLVSSKEETYHKLSLILNNLKNDNLGLLNELSGFSEKTATLKRDIDEKTTILDKINILFKDDEKMATFGKMDELIDYVMEV